MDITQNQTDIMAIETDVMAIETNLALEANPFDNILVNEGILSNPEDPFITPGGNPAEPLIRTKSQISAPDFKPEIDDMDLLNEELLNIQLKKEAEVEVTELITEITNLKKIVVDIYAKANPEKANFKA